jgi:hypothetical protein
MLFGDKLGGTTGFVLFNYTDYSVRDILSEFHGVRLGSDIEPDGEVFEPNGWFVPEPTSLKPKYTQYVGSRDLGTSVALIDLGSRFVAQQEVVRRVLAQNGTNADTGFAEGICACLEPIVGVTDVRFLGGLDNAPELFATTIDNSTNRYIGLHVDSWFRLPISKRLNAPNRISINLGRDTRTFLFASTNIVEMAETFPNASSHPTELARYYFSEKPQTSIYALKVPPGCAYLAPTENVAHDASTIGMAHVDRTATMLGRFLPLDGRWSGAFLLS